MKGIRLLVVIALSAAGPLVRAQEFPLRAKYPELSPISTEQVAQEIGKSVVIDVRSEFEYSVMHIDGAQHVDLSDPAFISKLGAAVGGDKSKGVITYCNGITCEKSYEGAREAQRHGFSKVRVYDAGILEWARMARGRTLLFGKPVTPEGVITEAQYEAHVVEAGAFESGAAGTDALLIDVRDANQRTPQTDVFPKAQWVTLDQLVKRLETPAFKSSAERKTLYFFDNVGKQVRWLQYALKANGYERYFFLKGGAEGLARARASHN
jgi:rhodanese-related sulfurtransferase